MEALNADIQKNESQTYTPRDGYQLCGVTLEYKNIGKAPIAYPETLEGVIADGAEYAQTADYLIFNVNQGMMSNAQGADPYNPGDTFKADTLIEIPTDKADKIEAVIYPGDKTHPEHETRLLLQTK